MMVPRRSALPTVIALAIAGGIASGSAEAQQHGHMHGLHHGPGSKGHDEATMPGLRGENASPEESAEIALMFHRFDTISREVENLADGIRTVTRASDSEVATALISHAVGMIDRVDRKDDPRILIQSPTLDIFFLRGDEIVSDIDVMEDGVTVIQTSDNPDVVAALHAHAAEVTDMAERGMAAVHEMMMRQGRSH